MLTTKQRANADAVLAAVAHRGHNQSWSYWRAHQVARMALMCMRTESNLWIYANWNVPTSLALPHDAVGSDHASVGLFQQQVPSWGTAARCMSPAGSAYNFMGVGSLMPGLAQRVYLGHPADEPVADPASLGVRVQQVQVSAFPDRYQVNYPWAGRYLDWTLRFRRIWNATGART